MSGGWQTVNKKKPRQRNNSSYQSNVTPNLIESSHIRRLSERNTSGNVAVNENRPIVTKEPQVSLILNLSWVTSSELLIESVSEKLKELKLNAVGELNSLLEVIWIGIKGKRSDFVYRNYDSFNKFLREKVIYTDNNIEPVIQFIVDYFEIRLIIYSLQEVMDIIYYGKKAKYTLKLLHVRFKDFFLLSDEQSNSPKFQNEQKRQIENLFYKKVVHKKRNIFEKLNKIRKDLKDLAQRDDFDPSTIKKNEAMQYTLYTDQEVDNMTDLMTCVINFTSPHSGEATIIEGGHDLHNKTIQLTSRRSCGYNTFDGDTVLVQINQRNEYNENVPLTGRVVKVINSNIRPKYSIFLCKMCRDQGTLMKPYDGSIPKIHVDNEPGRQEYDMSKLKKEAESEKSKMETEQFSEELNQRAKRSHGDNCYVSIFDCHVTRDKKVEFKNAIVKEVDPETCRSMFVVVYEYWSPQFMYPSGKIVDMINVDDDSDEHVLSLISTICNVDSNHEIDSKEVIKIKQKINDDKVKYKMNLPKEAIVFTIDNDTTKDMDDALSYQLTNNNRQAIIGVHITDITRYITKNTTAFKKAQSQCLTFYSPINDPIHMLNKELSEDLLSLIPGEPRRVISVYFHFDLDCNKICRDMEPKFKQETIISKYKLNYYEVQEKLNIEVDDDDFSEEGILIRALNTCYNLARNMRYERLKSSFHVRQLNNLSYKFCNAIVFDTFDAHILIEEFMILANTTVAEFVYRKHKDNFLIRKQNPVNDYEEWVENVFKTTNMDFCATLKTCLELLKINRNNAKENGDLIVSRYFYNTFKYFIDIENYEAAKSLLQYDELYNDFYFHIIKWYHLNNPGQYSLSEEIEELNRHFQLNRTIYTHFTSPIRRFTDMIVHIMLKNTLENQQLQFFPDEIVEICSVANRARKNQKTFEKYFGPYKLNDDNFIKSQEIVSKTEINRSSFIRDCVITQITEDGIEFSHPDLNIFAKKKIKFGQLRVVKSPVNIVMNSRNIDASKNITKCELRWSKIILSLNPMNQNLDGNFRIQSTFKVPSDLFDSRLPGSRDTVNLFKKIRKDRNLYIEDFHKLLRNFQKIDYKQRISSDYIGFSDRVIKIEWDLILKNTIQIQVCCMPANGLKKVMPELLIVSETFQICLIHNEDHIYHFIEDGQLKLKFNDVKKSFENSKEYKDYFLPLIQVESLIESLSEHSAYTLTDVGIKFFQVKNSFGKIKTYGIFEINEDYMRQNNVEIFSEKYANEYIIDRVEYLCNDVLLDSSNDLLCLRCKQPHWANYWTGHGEVMTYGLLRIKQITKTIVIFKLIQSSFNINSFIKSKPLFIIDVYDRTIISRRELRIVKNIDKNLLLSDIVLGNISRGLELNELEDKWIKKVVSENREKLNYFQRNAVKNALQQKLSLIWGPPGTGKTNIGCILSKLFVKINRRKDYSIGVVLYCGPSNDCVDLVAYKLLEKQGDCPKLIRIYGKTQQQADFPIPGILRNLKPKLVPENQCNSLHYLIRESPNSPKRELIKEYDKYFRNYMDNIKIDETEFYNIKNDVLNKSGRLDIIDYIKSYKMLIKEAEKEYLAKEQFEMVLCTTSVAAKSIIKENFHNILQVIIDEAGMCREPETLIPINAQRGEQKDDDEEIEETEEDMHSTDINRLIKKEWKSLVLIGDHKQLRPIIQSNLANKRGLQISLFERYQSLRPELVTMLNYQYRMHPSICEFPSIHFYGGRLKTQVSDKWSGLSEDIMFVKYEIDYEYRDLMCIKRELYQSWNGIDYTVTKKPNDEEHLRLSNYIAIPNESWPGQRKIKFKCFNKGFKGTYPERIVFIHVNGTEIIQSVSTAEGNESSRANNDEIIAVNDIYKRLIVKLNPPRLAPNFVTVITQYKLQETLLREKLQKTLTDIGRKQKPEVKTVIRSQGSENDYIIFSTVRSLPTKEDIVHNPSPGWERKFLGFITDPNQINVALTRAKKGLIIIGNKDLLGVNHMWKKLLANLKERNCILNRTAEFRI